MQVQVAVDEEQQHKEGKDGSLEKEEEAHLLRSTFRPHGDHAGLERRGEHSGQEQGGVPHDFPPSGEKEKARILLAKNRAQHNADNQEDIGGGGGGQQEAKGGGEGEGPGGREKQGGCSEA